MAKKIFTFRGKNLEELQKLSISELSDLFTADIRRKIKRGFTEKEKKFLEKITTKNNVKTHCRDMVILPIMVGKVVKVYKGNGFEDLHVTQEMIGHRLGEYVMTRKRVTHGSAGVGASKSTANQGRK